MERYEKLGLNVDRYFCSHSCKWCNVCLNEKLINHNLELVNLHDAIRASGKHNFEGLQIPIKTNLNV
jgi:hypothetical protein